MAYHLSDSDADSEFLGFTQSAINDNKDNLSDISDVELSASSSSEGNDDENDEENDSNDNTVEFGDYHDNLIDEVIGQQLVRNPPNWSAENCTDFLVPNFTGKPDVPKLPDNFPIDSAGPLNIFSLYFTDELLEQIVIHANSYPRFCILKQRQFRPKRTIYGCAA